MIAARRSGSKRMPGRCHSASVIRAEAVLSGRRFSFLFVGMLLLVSSTLAVRAHAQSCVSVRAGVSGWWPAEASANDVIGGSHGVLQNGAAFATGRVGQAFLFDGVNDFIELSPTSRMDFGTGDFTIEGWVNFNSVAGRQEILHKVVGTVPNDRTYFIEQYAPTTLRFMVRGTASNQNDLNVPTSLVPGQWYHLAAVRQGNSSTIYLDGSVIGSQTAGTNVDTGSGGFARIGQIAPNGVVVDRPFNGKIDELTLFGRALTSFEILAIFDAGAAGKCLVVPGLHGWAIGVLTAMLVLIAARRLAYRTADD